MLSSKKIQLSLLAILLSAPAFAEHKAEHNAVSPSAETALKTCPTMNAKVNGVAIPASKMQFLIKQTLQNKQPLSAEACANMLENLITAEAVAQKAKKIGMDKQTDVKTEIDMNVQSVLFRSMFRSYLEKNPVSDAAIQAEFDKVKPSLPKEYNARHILVKTEEEANAILAEIKAGKKFADLAKEKSLDPGSKENGGELGWAPATNYVQPFGEAVMSQKEGEVSAKPIKTDYGYHIIEVIGARDNNITLDQVRPKIEQQLQSKQFEEFVKMARSDAKIVK